MKLCGAEYVASRQCYYTDRHETEANKTDRSERYIPDYIAFARRAPIFVSVRVDQATEEALKFTRRIYDLKSNDPLGCKIKVNKINFTLPFKVL